MVMEGKRICYGMMGSVKGWTCYGRAGHDGQMGVMVREGEMFGGLDDGGRCDDG